MQPWLRADSGGRRQEGRHRWRRLTNLRTDALKTRAQMGAEHPMSERGKASRSDIECMHVRPRTSEADHRIWRDPGAWPLIHYNTGYQLSLRPNERPATSNLLLFPRGRMARILSCLPAARLKTCRRTRLGLPRSQPELFGTTAVDRQKIISYYDISRMIALRCVHFRDCLIRPIAALPQDAGRRG